MTDTADFLKDIGAVSDGSQNPPAGDPPAPPAGNEPPAPVPVYKPNEIFGDDYQDWEKVKTEIPAKLQRFSDMEKQLESLKSIEYADTDVEGYNQWIKSTGVKSYSAYDRFKNSDSLDGVDALVAKQLIENPELIGSEDRLRAKLLADYKLDPELFSAEEVKFNTIQAKKDFESAKSFLTGIKDKMKVIPSDPEAKKEASKKKHEAWLGQIGKSLEAFDKMSIPVAGAENKIETLSDYAVKPEIKQRIVESLAHTFSGVEMNEENAKYIEPQFVRQFVYENLPYIIKHATDIKEAQLRKEYDERYGGGLTPKSPGGGSGTGDKDQLQELFDKHRT